RPLAYLADEYYLLAGRPFPPASRYGAFDMHEDGIGMAAAFEMEFHGATDGRAIGVQPGFFAWVDGAPAEGYRAPRWEAETSVPVSLGTTRGSARLGASSSGADPVKGDTARGVTILTGTLGAQVIGPLVATLGRSDVTVVAVANEFFGGNIGVTGLMVGEDVARAIETRPRSERVLLPDVCLSGGRFLDGMALEDLPRPVEVVATDGVALRGALERQGALVVGTHA
ncbi:MAG TPA: DUF512 domain-containing protein, partial [Microthrixaceae bacterium]|nr:DUF512 domain-containing protein [Microthrixaceae bacterium]